MTDTTGTTTAETAEAEMLEEQREAWERSRQDSPANAKSGAGGGDRFRVMRGFVNSTLRTFREREKKTVNPQLKCWLVLWNDTDARTGTARTSIASVAERAGCSERTAKRALAALKSAGLLQVVRKGGLNRGPNEVRVLAVASAAK